LFEVAIHPNFNKLISNNNGTVESVIDELLYIHPEAKGVRSHSMMQSSFILQKFADRGIIYDANHFLPYQTGIRPFRLWNGLVRIIYNWEDDVHWAYGYDFTDSKIELDSDGLNIFDFHPIHIYLNTENDSRYQNAKKYYNEPDLLINYRNKDKPGTRDLFISLLKDCKKNQIKTHKLIDIAGDFLKDNP
jgi:hypothetical protein